MATFNSLVSLLHQPKLISSKSPVSLFNRNPTITCSVHQQPPTLTQKLQNLNSEFKSLPEAISRVKRLLHYADLLPPLDSCSRTEGNRVTGCAVRVWLEVKMDESEVMRFRMDSDSEIAKGFCYCLFLVLDGSKPEEVVSVGAEELSELNIGVHVRGNSRVNTWQNVLITMQKKTKELIEGRRNTRFHGNQGCLSNRL